MKTLALIAISLFSMSCFARTPAQAPAKDAKKPAAAKGAVKPGATSGATTIKADPCKSVVDACKKAGYYEGGGGKGKGLFYNCVTPLTEGKKVADMKGITITPECKAAASKPVAMAPKAPAPAAPKKK